MFFKMLIAIDAYTNFYVSGNFAFPLIPLIFGFLIPFMPLK